MSHPDAGKGHLCRVSIGVREPLRLSRCPVPDLLSGPNWPEYVMCSCLNQSPARRWADQGWLRYLGLGLCSHEHGAVHRSREEDPIRTL